MEDASLNSSSKSSSSMSFASKSADSNDGKTCHSFSSSSSIISSSTSSSATATMDLIRANNAKTTRVIKKTNKKPLIHVPSPYIMFCKATRPSTVSLNPTASFGEIGKILGAKWNSMSDEEKRVSRLCYIYNYNT